MTINTTMDRGDLFKLDTIPIVTGLNDLIIEMYSKKLFFSNWYGYITDDPINKESKLGVGMPNRGQNYEALPGAADDGRIPWYLYWEITQVLTKGYMPKPGDIVLDAGGTSSLFSCYMASLGAEVHSIDLNPALLDNANRINAEMGWNMHSYAMNMTKLEMPDNSLDAAYSICVFEHLPYEVKVQALNEMARCLKPGKILSITFDYRNPGPDINNTPNFEAKNQMKTIDDVERAFLGCQQLQIVENWPFVDNGMSYLVHHKLGNTPYTFGSIFLQKKG